MALQKEIKINQEVSAFDNGLTCKGNILVSDTVYIKIVTLQVSKDGNDYIAMIDIDYSGISINGRRNYQCPINIDGDNFIKQGYNYLKTLQEFAGVIDC